MNARKIELYTINLKVIYIARYETPKEKIPQFQWINIPRASSIGYWTSSFIKRNTYQKNKVIRSLPILLLMHHDKYLQKYLLEILLCRDQSLWNRNFKQAERCVP